MAHNPEWHAEYLRLEIAANKAAAALRDAQRVLDRKRRPAGAQAAYDAALAVSRAASAARFDFEMTGCKIVDTATLPATEWARALRA
jgi:hypothetical protein